MVINPEIIERAYQLARSGECRTITEIRKTLKLERYEGVGSRISGPIMMRDLARLCRENTQPANLTATNPIV